MNTEELRHCLHGVFTAKYVSQWVNALVIDEDKIYILTDKPSAIIGPQGTTLDNISREIRRSPNFNAIEIRLIEYHPFQDSLIEKLRKHLPKKVYDADNLFEAIM